MKLDQRKMNVLSIVVDEYIKTGEPVGSKTIIENFNLNVSSATIRNDMAALEKMGFLQQPHTSAGRIPSYLGYRMYIEKLMNPEILSDEEKQRIDDKLLSGGATAQTVLENAIEALSDATGLAVVNSTNMLQFSVITRVEVIPAGKKLYALLMITSTGDIKNKICRLEFDLTHEQLGFFTDFINENLKGKNIENLTPAMLQNLAVALGSYMISLSPLLYAVYELSEEFYKDNVKVSGQQKLLGQGEIDSAEALKFFNEKQEISQLLSNAFSGMQVVFGKENDTFTVTNSSMIMAPYQIGGELGGSFGVIGPLRIDYAKVIPYMKYLSESVTRMLSQVIDDIDDKER